MLRVPTILVLSVLVAGCATGIKRDLPQCDGRNKRPLNVGLWHPEDPGLARQATEATGSKVLFTPVETTTAVPMIVKSYVPVEQATASAPFAAFEAPIALVSSC